MYFYKKANVQTGLIIHHALYEMKDFLLFIVLGLYSQQICMPIKQKYNY